MERSNQELAKQQFRQQLGISDYVIKILMTLKCFTVSDVIELDITATDNNDELDLETSKVISVCKKIGQAQIESCPGLFGLGDNESAKNDSINFIRVFCFNRGEDYTKEALERKEKKIHQIIGCPFYDKYDMVEVSLINPIKANSADLDIVLYSVTPNGLAIGETFIPFSNISHIIYRPGCYQNLWPTYELQERSI